MKKKLAILAAMLIAMGTFAGCGDSAGSSLPSTPDSVPESSSTTSSGEDSKEITQLLFVNTLFTIAEDELQTFYHSPVYAKLREKTGVELLMRGADTDQAAIYFASGDLGDITNIRTQADIQSAVERSSQDEA